MSQTATIVQGDPRLTDTQPAPDETPSTTTSLSTHSKLHLSVIPTHGLSTSSRRWKALVKKILLRDKVTCSSCGYLFPYPRGRSMIIDHKDGNTSNNDPSNLGIHCPPCNSIRNCVDAGLENSLIVAESTMDQVEIVRKTREMFEKSGIIPHPKRIDPSVKQPVDIEVLFDLEEMMMIMPWKVLPEEFHRLRGFFTKNSSHLFLDTMLPTRKGTRKDTVEPSDDSAESLFYNFDRKAAEIAARETCLPTINYKEELHGSSQVFLDSWLPSKTLSTQASWIRVYNHRSAESEDEYEFPDLYALSSAWDKICAKRRPTLLEVDKLAKQFNVYSGKWLVFASSDNVDNLWRQIAKSTLAGTLGNSAVVSTHNENEPDYEHVICVCNADYRSLAEVTRLREELRRLGVKRRSCNAYKPDIYSHCGIYKDNRWGIPASLYHD